MNTNIHVYITVEVPVTIPDNCSDLECSMSRIISTVTAEAQSRVEDRINGTEIRIDKEAKSRVIIAC